MHTGILWLFVLGVLMQGVYALWARPLSLGMACAGALCVAIAAAWERDITLLLGQCVVLYVLYIAKNRRVQE